MSYPIRWRHPFQCTQNSHHRQLSMFLPQHSEPWYRQWFMVAKIYINNLCSWSISFGVALHDSGSIPAIIFCKLSTAKHVFGNSGQVITFSGRSLKINFHLIQVFHLHFNPVEPEILAINGKHPRTWTSEPLIFWWKDWSADHFTVVSSQLLYYLEKLI